MLKVSLSALGAAVAISMASPASAVDGFDQVAIGMPQINLNTVFSDVSLYAKWVAGDLKATSIAIGNNFIVDTEGSTLFRNDQYQPHDVGATLTATVKHSGGDVDLSAVGICNNAAFTVSESRYSEAWSHQRCATQDPFAVVNANVFGADGGVGVTATAIANNLAIDAQTGALDARFAQANASAVYASVNTTIVDVGGDVNVSAAAIGNNASITTRFTKP